MRASVIGTGFGASVVARIYRQIGIDVNVVSPRDPHAVANACAAPVDVVSVHSPPFLHRQHVLQAIEHGRHVLCDKPFGLNATEARDMLDAASAAGIVHLLNFEFRHDAARVRIKELLSAGTIGELQHVHWRRFTDYTRTPLMRHGWLFEADQGGGWIGAYGSHVIDALRWLGGDITDVNGARRLDLPFRPDAEGVPVRCTAEDAFSASFTFASGATATVDTSSASATSQPQHIEVLGSEGSIVLDGTSDLVVRHGEAKETKIVLPTVNGDVHVAPFTRWAELVKTAVQSGDQLEPSFNEGVACAELMDALKATAMRPTWPSGASAGA